MFAGTLPRERRQLLTFARSLQRHILTGLPAVPVTASLRVVGEEPEPLRVVICGECDARPGDARARTCRVANCGLIGRAHHGTGVSL